MQRINELAPCATEEQIRHAEEYCEKKSGWVYDENESEWVNSFKKYSNSDSKLKKRVQEMQASSVLADYKQEKGIEKIYDSPPFMSKTLVKNL
jgi:hypothetical protein